MPVITAAKPAEVQDAVKRIFNDAAVIDTDYNPNFLAGDFNAEPGREKTHGLFVGDGFFVDTWTSAPTRRNEGLDTFHNFKGAKKGTFRIDWILTRGPWECIATEVVVCSRDGQFPSDHHPVMAELRLP